MREALALAAEEVLEEVAEHLVDVRALAEAPDCPLLGLKLQTKPASLTVPQRLAVIQDGLNALR